MCGSVENDPDNPCHGRMGISVRVHVYPFQIVVGLLSESLDSSLSQTYLVEAKSPTKLIANFTLGYPP